MVHALKLAVELFPTSTPPPPATPGTPHELLEIVQFVIWHDPVLEKAIPPPLKVALFSEIVQLSIEQEDPAPQETPAPV
jgi:hypothetical protein